MTTKNAILMIVKQNNGIDYNSLLSKFASSYSNINSARAALSRSLKDLTSFGLLERKGGRVYLLLKGESEIYSAVKNKLVLSLNASLRQRQPSADIDSIVEKLQALIERAKQDKDLLRTSKSSLDFRISDLEKVRSETERKARHLDYLTKVLGEQVGSLKDMDFYDANERSIDREAISVLTTALSAMPESEFTVECRNPQVLSILAENAGAKPRETSFSLPKDFAPQFLDFLLKNRAAFAEPPIVIFSSVLKAQFHREKMLVSGPFSEVRKFAPAQENPLQGQNG